MSKGGKEGWWKDWRARLLRNSWGCEVCSVWRRDWGGDPIADYIFLIMGAAREVLVSPGSRARGNGLKPYLSTLRLNIRKVLHRGGKHARELPWEGVMAPARVHEVLTSALYVGRITLRVSCVESEVGLSEPLVSLPTWDSLCFCDYSFNKTPKPKSCLKLRE